MWYVVNKVLYGVKNSDTSNYKMTLFPDKFVCPTATPGWV